MTSWSYRAGFLAALAGNVVLVGIVAILWWHFRAVAPAPGRPSPMGNLFMTVPTPGPASRDQAEAPRAPVQLSPQRLQSIGVRTGQVQRKTIQDEIRSTGNVVVDETRLAYVQARFSGYIHRVFVDATYRYVRQGQPLFSIYSPELVAAEHEYLIAKESQRRMAHSTDPGIAADAASLVEASAQRLRQWAIPRREIARLESSGQVQQELEIDSPASGYVTARQALPNSYVQPDTRLYTVADLSAIWVFAQVHQNDLGRLRVGGAARLTVDTYPGRFFAGRVDFIYPDIDMATRTARVRLVFANPDLELVPGMFVNVVLAIPMGEQLIVPASGVLQSGTRTIAFIDRGGGSLEPRDVELGARVGDDFIVLRGLTAGERIVTSANFLIDSESQLQAALGTFVPPPPAAGGAGGAGAAGAAQGAVELTTEPAPVRKGGNLFRVRLADARGVPVNGADVTVTLDRVAMPAMGMGAMRVTVTLGGQGNGLYQGSGQLESGGTWQVTIVAKTGGRVVASQQLALNATGGM